MKTLAEFAKNTFGARERAAYQHLLSCGANPQATDASPAQLKLPRLMIIRRSNTTPTVLVVRRDDVSIVEYRSRRDYPGNCYLHCKVYVAPLCLLEGDFAYYYTREFAEAALAKIQAAFDAGETEIDIPKDGLYEPFKEYYKGKIVNSWEIPRHSHKSGQISLFDDFTEDDES